MALSDLYRPQKCPNCHSWHIWLAGYHLDLKCPVTGLQIPIYRCCDCGWESKGEEQRKEVANRVGDFLIELGKKFKNSEK